MASTTRNYIPDDELEEFKVEMQKHVGKPECHDLLAVVLINEQREKLIERVDI